MRRMARVAAVLAAVCGGLSGVGGSTWAADKTSPDGEVVVTENVRGQYVRYHADHIQINLLVPKGVKEIRGVVAKPADAGVDDKPGIWSTPMDQWGFSEVGMMLDEVDKGGGRETKLANHLPKALKLIGEKVGHPELANAPIVALGMSKGGGWSAAMCRVNSDRAIGYVNVVGWIAGDPAKLLKENPTFLKVPGLFLIGSVPDGFKMLDAIGKEYEPAMAQGNVDWTLALQWGVSHGWSKPSSAFVITFLDQVIKMRLPADASTRSGVPKLKTLNWDEGWAGDKSTWASATPVITPLKDYKGEKKDLVWIPNRYLAYFWRAYMLKSPEVTFGAVKAGDPIDVNERNREYFVKAGSALEIPVNVKGDAKKVTVYDGDIKLGETTAGGTFTYHATEGSHAIIALVEDGGTVKSSNVLWVVGAK